MTNYKFMEEKDRSKLNTLTRLIRNLEKEKTVKVPIILCTRILTSPTRSPRLQVN